MSTAGRGVGGWVGRAAVLAVAAACGSAESATAPQGAVLILLDTLRADHVSSYGYARETTPRIDGLAARGVRFERAVSSAPWTLPATAALLSGDAPGRVLDADNRITRSLVQEFAAQGIATAAFTEGGFVSRHFGFDLGFHTFHEEEGPVVERDETDRTVVNTTMTGDIAETFGLAQQWLRRHRKERFVLLIHTYEVHTPYVGRAFTEGLDPGRVGERYDVSRFRGLRTGELVLTASEREWITALYDGDIRRADRFVGRLLAFLEELQLADRTVVVVTADHGEELGQHFERFSYDHGHSLRDDLLLVPLIVHDPTRSFGRSVVHEQVRLMDTLPTLAELMGVALPDGLPGRSLVPLMTGAERQDRVAISSQTKTGPPRASLRDGRFKFIRSLGPDRGTPVTLLPAVPGEQLYDLAADPGEVRNVVDEHPELARELGGVLDAWRAALRPGAGELDSSKLDPQLLERLRALGYLR